jgi:hypothetical protein
VYLFHLKNILIQNSTNYKTILKLTSISIIFSLSLKILQIKSYSNACLSNFSSLILTQPLIAKQFIDSCPIEAKEQLKEHDLLNRLFSLLSSNESIENLLNEKDINQSLSLLGTFS